MARIREQQQPVLHHLSTAIAATRRSSSTRVPGYETDGLTDMLIDYVRRERSGSDEPFFAVLSVQPPHGPYTAPEEFARKHRHGRSPAPPQRSRHSANHGTGKTGPGRLLCHDRESRLECRPREQPLHETGQIDNTHILFFSDHGDMHGSHGRWQKSTPWEESIRIPFIMSGMRPHTEHTGMLRTDAPINHVDIAPTSLGLCGIDVPDWMMGYDYSNYRNHKVARSLRPETSRIPPTCSTACASSTRAASTEPGAASSPETDGSTS